MIAEWEEERLSDQAYICLFHCIKRCVSSLGRKYHVSVGLMKVLSICDELIWEQRKKVKIKKKRGLKTVKEVSTTEPAQNYHGQILHPFSIWSRVGLKCFL